MPPPCEELTTSDPFWIATRVSPPGVMSAALVGAGLALPFLRVKANRLVPGEPLRLPEALAVLPAGAGWVALALLVALALVALPGQVGARGRAVAGALGVVLGAVLPLAPAARVLVFWAATATAVIPPVLYSYLHWRRAASR